jgi:glycosyltransferase involved in cell wall biosynthesis
VRIYNCVEPAARGTTTSPLPELCGRPFLLCVAQHRRNKNIPLLIRVFGSLLGRGAIHSSTNLVIVGITGPETASIHEMVAQRSLSRRVFFRDGLSDPELQWCYERSDALAVPSTTEGFGLPVAEGLLAGCRVICSDIPALREVGGEHCQYFALGHGQEQALADSITASLEKPRQSAVALPHLSAEVLGHEYINLYRQVLEKYLAKSSSLSGHNELRDSSALREV